MAKEANDFFPALVMERVGSGKNLTGNFSGFSGIFFFNFGKVKGKVR